MSTEGENLHKKRERKRLLNNNVDGLKSGFRNTQTTRRMRLEPMSRIISLSVTTPIFRQPVSDIEVSDNEG